jgi:hypothetical protein
MPAIHITTEAAINTKSGLSGFAGFCHDHPPIVARKNFIPNYRVTSGF